MKIHAHVRLDATDCDGRVQRGYIIHAWDDQTDDAFKTEVQDILMIGPDEPGEMDIQPGGFSVWEPTEEGSRVAHVTWCHEDCENARAHYRDFAAEAAGY